MSLSIIVITTIPIIIIASAIMAWIQPKFEELNMKGIILSSIFSILINTWILLLRCYIGPMAF
jgi:hypothetical protein